MSDKELQELEEVFKKVQLKANILNGDIRKAIDDHRKKNFPIISNSLEEWDLDITDENFASTLRGNAYRVIEWWPELEWPSITDIDYDKKKKRFYKDQSRLLGISMTIIYCAKKQNVDLMDVGRGLNLILASCQDNKEFKKFHKREREQLERKKSADASARAGPSSSA